MHSDPVLEHQVEAAGILALVLIEDEEATADEAAGVDIETDAVRRLETKADAERPGIARLEDDIGGKPNALHQKLERAERARNSGSHLEADARRSARWHGQ